MSGRHAAPARPPRTGRGRAGDLPGGRVAAGRAAVGRSVRSGRPGPVGRPPGPRPAGWLARRRPDPAIAGSVAVIAVLALFSFAGPIVYHANLTRVDLLLANRPPGPGHPLGTSSYGLDVLGQLMAGGQLSLEVGIAAGILAGLIGTLWGALAGYLGGAVDAAMMRIVDAGIAVPTLVLLLLLTAVYTPGPGTLVLVIAVTSWLGTARLVRGAALTLRTREYVQAVGLMGGGRLRAVVRHIVPNAADLITVNVSFQIADAVVLLATLSYLGLGIQPPAADWGDMVAGGIQNIYNGYWWQIYPAGLAIIAVVVAFNVLGDALADRLDRGGRTR